MKTTYHGLSIEAPSAEAVNALENALAYIPTAVLRFMGERGIRVRVLAEGEQYAKVSGTLSRLDIDVDAWPSPPAGLFVVEERTVYLRSLGAMTVVHELGHALDLALGGDVYHSCADRAIRAAYANAKAFVTPYACSGIDEWFAEGFRACLGANDTGSPWPDATPEAFAKKDAEGFTLVSACIADAMAAVSA